MQETLVFKTSYTEDSFKIWKGENLILKLFKSSWIGWTVDIKVDEKKYRLTRKGLWFPQITLIDKEANNEVSNTKVRLSFFGINPSAISKFNDGKLFEWNQKGLFNCNWTWVENDEVIIQAKENNSLFSLEGEISIINENKYDKLLSVLGLYLRSSIIRQNRIGFGVAFIFLALWIIRWAFN